MHPDASLIPAEMNFRIAPCCYGCQQYDDESYSCRWFDCHAPPNGLCDLFVDADPPRHGGVAHRDIKPEKPRAPAAAVRAAPRPAPKKLTCRIQVAVQPDEIEGGLGAAAGEHAEAFERSRWLIEPGGVRLVTPGGYLGWTIDQAVAAIGPGLANLPHAAAEHFGGPALLAALARICLIDDGA